MELLTDLYLSKSKGGKILGCAGKYSAHVTNMVEAWQLANNVDVGMDYLSYCKNIFWIHVGGVQLASISMIILSASGIH